MDQKPNPRTKAINLSILCAHRSNFVLGNDFLDTTQKAQGKINNLDFKIQNCPVSKGTIQKMKR